MATLDASSQVGLSVKGCGVNSHLSTQIYSYLIDYWPGHISSILEDKVETSYSFNSISYFPTFTITPGIVDLSYLMDYYFRIHYTPQIAKLGNILSDQTYNIRVWNSYFTSKTLSSITETTLPDVSLTSPVTLPATVNGLQELTFPIVIPGAGLSVISGAYEFAWDVGNFSVIVIGTRLILWPFAPNNEFTERREWKTEILTSIDGTEERHLLRSIPRTYFQYDFRFRTVDEFSLAQTIAKTSAHVKLGIPAWQDYIRVYNIIGGDFSIAIDTTNLELFVGQNILLWTNYSDYEVKTIASFTSSTVTFALEIIQPKETCFFIPVKVGVLNSAINFQTEDNHIQTCSISALSTEYYNTSSWSTETFNSLPVFTIGNITTGGLQDSFQREMTFIDSETGIYETYSKIEFTPQNYTLRIRVFGRENKHNLIRFLNYFKGKYETFYCPTFQQDLTIIYPDLLTGTTSFLIKTSGWSESGLYPIRISGSIDQNCTVLSVSSNSDGTDTVHLSSALTNDNLGVFRISKLLKVRLNSDNIELAYSRKECLTVTIPLIEVK